MNSPRTIKPVNSRYRMEDISGSSFGRLTVVRYSHKKGAKFMWLCRCECGKQSIVSRSDLTTGHTASCGCLLIETTRARSITHGETANGKVSKEFLTWCSMIGRCRRPSCKFYYRYGGRGIKVCKRWNSFDNFLADMGRRPSPRHSLDRINNDGDYTPSNCRWATKMQQASNTSRNHWVSAFGVRKTLSQWSRRYGLGIPVIIRRLKMGWPPGVAVALPPQKLRRSYKEMLRLGIT